ncbi:DHA2 family efflux MFS transporter permease subunit [Lewinella sp. IMCC34183]|uniref:DHA2 family efflux MFS transporter permease subunit n=1 Tax=Lewinella sp. IMCC34183 TaxID=2248762 RepID=UPI000E237965|nr:DHA2 family efflux MFS transporter permease subunit [Lewinella sp. IMCC34183]
MVETGIRKWLITATVILCSMLELIDVSIVNVALTDMMGNLGATLNEVSWVVAAYAIANVIIIPMAGFLSDRLGRRAYFIGSVVVFTIASVFCGLSTGIWELVAFRFLQGMAGGALLTTSQTILVESFPEEELGLANGLFGMGVIIGPTIGPTLGGYIVDNLSWHWIFFINLPVGTVAALLAYTFVRERPRTASAGRRSTDWLGIGLLVLGVGSLQLVLEKGREEDWFQSAFILAMSALAAAGIIGFIVRMLRTEQPIVDLRVLRYRNVAVGTFLSFIMGFGLFGSVFIFPIFAQQILGYTATQTGELLIPGALLGGFMMPLVGRLIAAGVSPKYLIPLGFALFAVFTFMMAGIITPETSQADFFWPLLVRGLGLGFLFLPLTFLSLQGLKGRDIPQSTGINNMLRQLGGSFGIAVLATYLGNRTVYNRALLGSHLSVNDPNVMNQVHGIANRLAASGTNAVEATQQAYRVLSGMLSQQAALVTYTDVFQVLGAFFLLCIPLVLFIRRVKGAGATGPVSLH